MKENICSLEEHKEIKAVKYCPKCEIYMCNKCEKYHSSPIFKNHHPYNLSNEDEIFTGFCKEKNRETGECSPVSGAFADKTAEFEKRRALMMPERRQRQEKPLFDAGQIKAVQPFLCGLADGP